jgi:two-component system, sensor histidine kinase and response regulator
MSEPFDREMLLERLDGDRELLGELFEDFLQDKDDHLKAGHAAIAASSIKGMYDAVHALRGCVANFCATRAFDVACRLQEHLHGDFGDDIAPLFKELEGEIAKLTSDLRAFVEQG